MAEDEEGLPPVVEVELNPKGYGLEQDFVPTAHFDVSEGDISVATDTTSEYTHLAEDELESEITSIQEIDWDEIFGADEGEGEGGELESEPPEEEMEAPPPPEVTFDVTEAEQVAKPKKEMYRRRTSVRKKSISYAAKGRFDRGAEGRVSGDFAALTQQELFERGQSPPSIASYVGSDEFSVGPVSVEEEEAPAIDREVYYTLYKTLLPDRLTQRMRNNFLQRKMAEYFRKKKMEHVLKESDQQVDSQGRYDRKLDQLGELKDLDTRERDSTTAELDDLRNQRDEQLELMEHHFNAMQTREKDVGSGLINTKTGKAIPDKVVERLVRRQVEKWNEVATMRLTFIKLRDRVQEKKDALHALDNLGEGLHLIDYEQLKVENTSHTDKLEERDEELGKLRVKCESAMQCLAHVREKSAAVVLDILSYNDRYDEVYMEYMECRERLNYFKKERDDYRISLEKMYDDAGLLSKHKLLSDMEQTLEIVAAKRDKLQQLKHDFERNHGALQAIKHNMGRMPSKPVAAKSKSELSKKAASKIYRGRPTLIYPQLPMSESSAFEVP